MGGGSTRGGAEQITISPNRAGHVFPKQGKPGHLPDTPENRQLLITTTSKQANFLGTDKFGNDWYAAIRPDGKQVWVQVRGNTIINGGLNRYPECGILTRHFLAQRSPDQIGEGNDYLERATSLCSDDVLPGSILCGNEFR
jgi:hypothetical protein